MGPSDEQTAPHSASLAANRLLPNHDIKKRVVATIIPAFPHHSAFLSTLGIKCEMDFSSQLANLQRSAAAASQQQRSPDNSRDEQQQQQRHDRRHRHHDQHRPKRQRRDSHAHSNPPSHRGSRRYWNEHALERALATLPHFRIPPPAETPQPGQKQHIALLMVTIEDLPFEHLWRAWANDSNTDLQVSLLCHAKFPRRIQSEWLRQRMLTDPPVMGRGNEYQAPTYHSRRPEWGSIEITRAMLDLLHEGLKIGGGKPQQAQRNERQDARFSLNRYAMHRNTPEEVLASPLPPVNKFIFVSETCIPVATLAELQTALVGDETQQHVSWVNARNTPNNGYSKQLQFDKIHPVVPKSCLWKADQWCVLSRAHARAVMDIDGLLPRDHFLWECFLDTKASDELYFPTALGLLGVLPSSPTIALKRITYVDWSVSSRNPASFVGLSDLQRVAKLAREEGCLFARKFVLSEENLSAGKDGGGSKKDAPGYICVDDWKAVMASVASPSDDNDGTAGAK